MISEFRILDALVVGLYLLCMAGAGIYFARKNRSTEEYFLGGRNFPGWAVGLSMLGTSISSVTFLAFPAAAYSLDWRLMVPNLMLPLVAVLAVVYFIPFFRRGNLTSAFEYLEDRFGPLVRLYGTLSFILLQLIRLGKVLFLISIPAHILTGIPIVNVIVCMGVFIAFYTVAGGISAVIWTDVVQAVVLWLGGLACVVFIAWNLPGGFGQIFETGAADGKFSLGGFDWNLHERTFWIVALLGIFNWLGIYSGDQNYVQRYVASRSTREARKATVIYTSMAVPTWAFFFFVGTCVYAWYKAFPDTGVVALEADQVFPYFILTQIPAGLAGLVIAGVIAAAMSSLDSSINAIATITVVDILKRFLLKNRSDRFYLNAARAIAVAVSIMMILGAMIFSVVEKESMNDLSWIMASVFGGCMVGLFMLGFFTTRVDNASVTIALFLAIGFNIYLGLGLLGWLPEACTLKLHSYYVGIVVNLLFAAIAYALSFMGKAKPKDLEQLTVWTMRSTS